MQPFYTGGNGSIREPSVAKTQCELHVRSKTTKSVREKAYLLILLCYNGANWSGHFCGRFSGVCGEETDTVRVKLEFGLWRGAKSLARRIMERDQGDNYQSLSLDKEICIFFLAETFQLFCKMTRCFVVMCIVMAEVIGGNSVFGGVLEYFFIMVHEYLIHKALKFLG